MFELKNVSFSSQEIYLKQRSPSGSGKKNNALLTRSPSGLTPQEGSRQHSTIGRYNEMVTHPSNNALNCYLTSYSRYWKKISICNVYCLILKC
jgi:hypothetical protein